ncbi:MAG: VWA-like domain-containing protein [Desulfobacterales bacterium]|nr:VWA-like domain-containing protein [Desulfobacterales bacterium]
MAPLFSDPSAHDKMLKARSRLVMEQPFFASLALRLTLSEDSECDTAWTDGTTLGYNPAYVHRLSPETLMGVCAHTVMHPACDHHRRRNNRDPEVWNRACDLAVNPILLDAGMELPPGFLYDPALAGQSADAIYDHLTQCDCDEKEEGAAEPSAVDPFGQKEPEKEETAQSPEAGESRAREEGGEKSNDPGMAGEVRDGEKPGAMGSDESTEDQWEEALIQAASNAREMGKLPRGIDRWVEEVVNPKLPWQQLLAQFIQKAARSDYSWTRPNPRYLSQDLYLPSLGNHELGELVVAVDTSGSIQPRELDRFGAEISAILDLVPARVHLLHCDMAVNEYQTFTRYDLPITLKAKGGGGTDFRPAFDFVRARGIRPDCMIYLSDMECRLFPTRAPEFPLLWVKTGLQGNLPPFGQVLSLD